MVHFLARLIISAASLWVAVRIVPGITWEGEFLGLVGVALVFGAVNALIRPLLVLLTCPLVILTLGLFVFVLNGVLLMLTAWLSAKLGLHFAVAGFWAAFFGAVIVGTVSTILNLMVGTRRA